MTKYLFKRFLSFIPTLIGVSLLVFFTIRLIPGDAIIATLGTQAGMLSETQRASLEKYYGLDKPAIKQYLFWASGTLTGNLGFSVRHGKAVSQLIKERFPLTLELTILAVIISLLLGIPIGLLSAIRQNTIIDILARLFSLIGLALPNFLIGTLIIYVLSVYFHVLPTSGDYTGFLQNPLKNMQQLIFPAITLGFAFSASVMRMTRSSMLEVLNQDYVRTARSKGLREGKIIIRHAFRNALIPVVTLIAVEIGYLLGGAFIVEQIFALPGLGRLIINAVSQREYALVQGSALFIALNVLTINLLVDLLYAALDPRISYE